MSRKIWVVGEINNESYLEFSRKLTKLEEESSDLVQIELNSGGGVATDGLAFYSRMKNSPCNFEVYAYGLVASAATLILVGAHTRYMAKETWFMVHEDEVNIEGARVTPSLGEMKQYVKMENQWNTILAKHTKVKKGSWKKMNLSTTYLSAEECLKLGVIDEIL